MRTTPAPSRETTGKPEAPARPKIEFDLKEMKPWREFAVILFNDDVHSQEDVVVQLIRALKCTPNRAYSLMLEAHHKGQATVAIAPSSRAFQIVTILRQIDLKVALRQIN